jgi:hypothetical protein
MAPQTLPPAGDARYLPSAGERLGGRLAFSRPQPVDPAVEAALRTEVRKLTMPEILVRGQAGARLRPLPPPHALFPGGSVWLYGGRAAGAWA